MRQVTLGAMIGCYGLSVLLASGCGGSTFFASNGAGGESNGGSGTAGMIDTGGMTNSAGMIDTGGMTNSAGMVDTGGMIDTGGATSSGGRSSRGGATSAGGKSSGGATSAGGKSSGGATSAGGKSGSGGTMSSAGNTGTAGTGGSASCATGAVTFKMVPKNSDPTAFCSGCSANWLTVTDSNGQAVTIDRSCSVPDCGACMPTACPPIACLNQSVPAEGLSRSWDETHWVDSTCSASALACAGAHCVAPGKYKAKMCAFKNTTPNGNSCSPGASPVCTEVDFVLPGAPTVQGVIGG